LLEMKKMMSLKDAQFRTKGSTFLCERAFQTGTPCCTILTSISEGVFTINLDKKITFLNSAAESITGFSVQEAMGQYCFDIFRSNVCQVNCPLDRAIKNKEPVYDQSAVIINKAGRQIAISLTADLLRNDRGEIIGAVEVFRDVSIIETLRQTLSGRYRMGELISKNHRMEEIFEILPDIAESDSTVLIQGPSGSGKEVLANTIHDLSPRKGKPLIKVNCGSIPDTLLESELFGYVKGAFTDARKDKKGRFSLAQGGTLFLDEIGNTSPAMQVKLLRVIEEREFVPLGGVIPVKVDVRIIAATNQNLEEAVRRGDFREDLYYRLNIIKVTLPPLGERKEDIPLLVEHFIAQLNAIKGKNIKGVSNEVMKLLMNYHYPGNVRELKNILEHAFILCRGPLIEEKHLPLDLLEKTRHKDEVTTFNPLVYAEEKLIQEILKEQGGNRTKAAQCLGISRTTLWRKLKKQESLRVR